jgi:hypothetical protein
MFNFWCKQNLGRVLDHTASTLIPERWTKTGGEGEPSTYSYTVPRQRSRMVSSSLSMMWQRGHPRPDLVGDVAPFVASGLRRLLAKAVPMKVETTRWPLFPAWASAVRMWWTLQRSQVTDKTLETAALMPSCASETRSLVQRGGRLVSLCRDCVQIGTV